MAVHEKLDNPLVGKVERVDVFELGQDDDIVQVIWGDWHWMTITDIADITNLHPDFAQYGSVYRIICRPYDPDLPRTFTFKAGTEEVIRRQRRK